MQREELSDNNRENSFNSSSAVVPVLPSQAEAVPSVRFMNSIYPHPAQDFVSTTALKDWVKWDPQQPGHPCL